MWQDKVHHVKWDCFRRSDKEDVRCRFKIHLINHSIHTSLYYPHVCLGYNGKQLDHQFSEHIYHLMNYLNIVIYCKLFPTNFMSTFLSNILPLWWWFIMRRARHCLRVILDVTGRCQIWHTANNCLFVYGIALHWRLMWVGDSAEWEGKREGCSEHATCRTLKKERMD